MKYYSAIDLHSTNQFIVVIDENNVPVLEKRCPNKLESALMALEPYKDSLVGVAVESTYNWYWLVDGLIDNGFTLHLVNTTAVKSYSGLKHGDDKSDANWLAHLLLLGILPTGYIYPKAQRFVRDALRKRGQLVQMRTKILLSISSYHARHTGCKIATNQIYRAPQECLFGNEWQQLTLGANLHMFEQLNQEITHIEKAVLKHLKYTMDFELLKTVSGIGDILAMTILLEVGNIERFKSVGNFVSYCRKVDSKYLSNGKKKGEGNKRNGNRYLSWAFAEAAHFAIMHNSTIGRYFQRKRAKTNPRCAVGAVAHKLARASYYMKRDKVPFKLQLAFG